MDVGERYDDWLDIAKYDLLNNRYPDFMEKLSAQIREAEAKETLLQTREAFTWLLHLTSGYKDVFIEPTVFPRSEIQNGNPFVKEILRTGREI